jgi:hypothetical protein
MREIRAGIGRKSKVKGGWRTQVGQNSANYRDFPGSPKFKTTRLLDPIAPLATFFPKP